MKQQVKSANTCCKAEPIFLSLSLVSSISNGQSLEVASWPQLLLILFLYFALLYSKEHEIYVCLSFPILPQKEPILLLVGHKRSRVVVIFYVH